ncbi:helicase [Klebsiella phage K64-1]|uniref:Helicase n=1 Tax=Klebsiella phage K64-1 TaxID=1439894 RepID=A0A0A8JBN5_BPK64|nr:DEAD/DEAH box helicase family protein [Klebsiella phage K64-1]BAQ02812.1 helicase [Klebsiella phage K64-1]
MEIPKVGTGTFRPKAKKGTSCKLIIQDEVNCKFEGLDPSLRSLLIKEVSYILPYAKFTPAGRLGRWNGEVNFMNMGGGTYLHMLDKLLPILDEYEVQIELEDHRIDYGFQFDPIDENIFSDVVFPIGHHMEGKSIILREHQVNSVNACLANPHGLLLAATGAGKTIICAALARSVQKYGRSVIVVPSTDLVQQTYNDYVMMGLDTGMFCGAQKDFGHQHTITTWQSFNSLWKKTKKGEIELTEQDVHDFIDGVVCVIVDEVQTARGDALSNLLSKVMQNVPLRWGLTGTIPKDQIEAARIKCNLGNVIYTVTSKELQDKKILSTCNISCIKLKSSMKFENYAEELKFLTTDRERMSYVAKLIQALSESGNTLVLVDRIECGNLLCEFLGLPKSEFVKGDTKKKDRESSYGEIRWADNKILIATYGVASTGISISRLYNVVLIEPGKSFIKTIQSIGRGLRVAEDKDHVEIIDISSSTKYSAKHLRERLVYYKEAKYPHNVIEVKDWQNLSD